MVTVISKTNRLSSVVAQKLRSKGTLTYDNMMMQEIDKITNSELIEIGVLGVTKDNLIDILNRILDRVESIENVAHLDKNKSILNDVDIIYDIVNDIIKVLHHKVK